MKFQLRDRNLFKAGYPCIYGVWNDGRKRIWEKSPLHLYIFLILFIHLFFSILFLTFIYKNQWKYTIKKHLKSKAKPFKCYVKMDTCLRHADTGWFGQTDPLFTSIVMMTQYHYYERWYLTVTHQHMGHMSLSWIHGCTQHKYKGTQNNTSRITWKET